VPDVVYRYFFALIPSPALARSMVQLAPGMAETPMQAGRLHLTLFITGDSLSPDRERADALRIAGGLMDHEPTAMQIGKINAKGHSVALQPTPGHQLGSLHRHLAALAYREGVSARDGWAFSPHVTLGYGVSTYGEWPVPPLDWQADHVVLIESHAGKGRHVLLGRWPLIPRQLRFPF
jgi:2'-5' RNA ligase